LETIREYASERFAALPGDERREVEQRHTAFVHELATDAEPHLTAHDQMPWLDRLDREHDNVRELLDRAERDDRHLRSALHTAASIWRFWQQRGHLLEGRARLRRLLDLPAASGRDVARARALGALGSVEYWLTDYEAMTGHYDEAASIAEEIGDPRLLARALFDRSFEWLGPDELGPSLETLERCLEVAPDDDLVLRAKALMAIGYGRVLLGDGAAASELIGEAVELHRRAGERLALCEGLVARASIQVLAAASGGGVLDDAVADVIEATTLAAETPGPIMLAQVVMPQAIVAAKAQRFRRAAVLMGAWETLQVDHGVHFPDVGLSFFGDPAEESRAALGDHAYAEAFDAGRALTLDEMVAFLLDLDAGGDE
jgi:tetratricopeptide (TPR) repeat protein